MKRFKLIINGAFRNIGKHKIIFFGLLIQSVVSLILVLLLTQYYYATNVSYNSFKQYFGNKYFYSISTGNDNAFQTYMDNKNNEYGRSVDFLTIINNSEDFRFLKISSQPITTDTFTVPKKFNYQYDLGNTDTTFKDENGIIHQRIACFSLDAQCFQQFNIKIDSGKSFDKNDYNYVEGKTTPVLLGSEYNGIMKIGDKFKGGVLSDSTFEVIGFLKKNSCLFSSNNIRYLDRCMVIPGFNPTDKIPELHDKALLDLQFHDGILVSDTKDYTETFSFVQNASIEAKTYTLFSAESADAVSVTSLLGSSKDNLNLTLVLAISLIIFTIISLSFALITLITENYYEYGIHLICGASLKTIFAQIAGFSICVLLTSYLISIFLTLQYFLTLETIIIAFGICNLIFIISVIPSFFAVKKLDVSQLIRGKE